MAKQDRCSKVSFKTSKDAYRAIKRIRKTNTGGKIPRSAYICVVCGLWHISSKRMNRFVKARNYYLVEAKNKLLLSNKMNSIKSEFKKK